MKAEDNEEIKSIIHRNGFTQLIKHATCVIQGSKTLLDITATNVPATIVDYGVVPTSLSDHDLVAWVPKLKNKRFPARTVKCRNYAKYSPDKMNRDLEKVTWLPVLTALDVNVGVDIFNGIVKGIFNNIIR